MSRIAGKPSVLVEGSDALRELIETYATMDIKAFCAKWGVVDRYGPQYGVAKGFAPAEGESP